MKNLFVIASLVVALVLAAGLSIAKGRSSAEYGKQLFNDPALGGSANEKTCNSCHADGEGLVDAGANPKLAAVINKCVVGPLQGTKIDGRSVEMRSLKMYIQSLGSE